MSRLLFGFLVLALTAPRSSAQIAGFSRGEILITGVDETDPSRPYSRVVVYGPDGAFRRILASSATFGYFDFLVRDGVLIVSTPNEIQRLDASGAPLAKFTTSPNITSLAASRDGRIVTANSSGRLLAFTADGVLQAMRSEVTALGIDLSSDQCTAFVITPQRFASWNSCAGEAPLLFGPLRLEPTGLAIRILPDGSLLAAYRTDVSRVDGGGNVIRTYKIPGRSLALDVDGTSFWTSVGGTLVKVDIESGAILLLVHTPYNIFYVGVVGEPRAALAGPFAIPALSVYNLILLSLALAFAAILRLK